MSARLRALPEAPVYSDPLCVVRLRLLRSGGVVDWSVFSFGALERLYEAIKDNQLGPIKVLGEQWRDGARGRAEAAAGLEQAKAA